MKSGSLFLIILIVLSFLYIFFSIDRAKENVIAQNYSGKIDLEIFIAGSSMEDIPSYSPDFNNVLTLADRNSYDFKDYSMNSLYPLNVDYSKLNPRSVEIIGEREFRSIFGMAKYLQMNREFDLELDLFRNASKEADFKNYVHEYLTFIEYSYLNNIPRLVKVNQILEARKMAGYAYQRMLLIDTPPMYFINIGDRAIIDRILLYNMIFNDPRVLLSEPAVLKSYVDLLESEFRVRAGYKEHLEKIRKNYYPVDVAEYFLALDDFYKKDYQSAFNRYSKISTESPNVPLSHLAILMKARTLFWAFKHDRYSWTTIDEIVIQLDSIEDQEFLKTLKSDISYYRDTIEVNIPELQIEK